jgi:hypothetical protein
MAPSTSASATIQARSAPPRRHCARKNRYGAARSSCRTLSRVTPSPKNALSPKTQSRSAHVRFGLNTLGISKLASGNPLTGPLGYSA